MEEWWEEMKVMFSKRLVMIKAQMSESFHSRL